MKTKGKKMQEIEQYYNYLNTLTFMLCNEHAEEEDIILNSAMEKIFIDSVSRIVDHENKEKWLRDNTVENNHKKMIVLWGNILSINAFAAANLLLENEIFDIKKDAHEIITVLAKQTNLFVHSGKDRHEKKLFDNVIKRFAENEIEEVALKEAVISKKIAQNLAVQNYENAISLIKKNPYIDITSVSFITNKGEPKNILSLVEETVSGKIKINKKENVWIMELHKLLLERSLSCTTKKVSKNAARL